MINLPYVMKICIVHHFVFMCVCLNHVLCRYVCGRIIYFVLRLKVVAVLCIFVIGFCNHLQQYYF